MQHRALYRLMTWLSPSYPVGAYAYSHGLEYAVEQGFIVGTETAQAWIEDIVHHGAGFCDAVLLAAAYRAARAGNWRILCRVAEYAAAFAPSAELALESQGQGGAFVRVAQAVAPCAALARLEGDWEGPITYPVAVGAAAAGHDVPIEPTTVAYLHAFTSNLVSALVRLVPLGQSDGQRLTAALEPAVLTVAARAQASTLDDLGTAVPLADICSMRHETQYTRLFRS